MGIKRLWDQAVCIDLDNETLVSANKYKTIKTQPFTLNVEKGDGTSDNETSDFSNKDKDIHALKLGKFQAP